MSVRKTNSNPIITMNMPRKAENNSPKDGKPLPRVNRASFRPATQPPANSTTLWGRFSSQFKKPKEGSFVAVLSVSAAVPAVLMGAGFMSPQASAINPQTDTDNLVTNDDDTPIEIADEVINGRTNNERPAPQEFPPAGTFAEKTWNKVDRNRDGSIDSAEIKKYLGRVGVSPGFLGLVHNQAASEAMKMADTNRDGKISKFEIKNIVKKELKADEFDEQGNVKPEIIEKGFRELDSNRSNSVSAIELEASVKKAMAGNSVFGGTIASIARKIGMDVLDANKSGTISRAEFEAVAKDLASIRASVLGAD